MAIILKTRRSPVEILAALKLDALNPLAQEAAEEIERLHKELAGLQVANRNMAHVFWAALKQHGPLSVSEYRLKRVPDPPRFRMGRNAFNNDVKLEVVSNDEPDEPELAIQN